MGTEDLDGASAGSLENNSARIMLCASILDTDKDLNSLGALTVYVVDPDFCDFDKDRSEKSFTDNEIWQGLL